MPTKHHGFEREIIYCTPYDIFAFNRDLEVDKKIRLNWEKGNLSLDGDWDLQDNSLQTSGFESSLRAYLKGVNPATTDWWKKRAPVFGEDVISMKWSGWIRMYDEICKNGYHVHPLQDSIDEYITVCIARDGKIMFFNGLHRLACLKVAGKGAEKIPVEVVCRHEKWNALRRDILRLDRIYAQIAHPDLQCIPHTWGEGRAEAIIKRIPVGSTVLDAGAHQGAVSHVLASKGMKVTAIEINLQTATMLSRISRINGARFKAVHGSLMDVNEDFDVLVILNLVHHFLKNEAIYTKFLEWLSNRSFKHIYYMGHGRMWDEFEVQITQEEFRDRIMKTARLDQWEELPLPGSNSPERRKLFELR